MRIGFVSLPVVGHLNPMTAFACSLQSRGHDIAFIGVPDVEPFARAAGLKFVPYCEDEYPAGSICPTLRTCVAATWPRGDALEYPRGIYWPFHRRIETVAQETGLDCLGTIPSNVIVVRTAPQIELLKRAVALYHVCGDKHCS